MRTIRGNRIAFWTAMTAGMLLAGPAPAHGQVNVGISVDWWDWIGDVRVHGSVNYGTVRDRPIHRDHGYVHPPLVVYEGPARVRERRGPPFCRSGAGHPVHGWRWCVRKGFARAHRRHSGPRRAYPRRSPVRCCTWHPADLGPIHLRPDRQGGIVRPLGHEQVVGVLGRGVVEDLYTSVGYRQDVPLEGRWYPSAGDARVLQVRAGPIPLAELTDLDGDGRVDRTFLARTHRVDR